MSASNPMGDFSHFENATKAWEFYFNWLVELADANVQNPQASRDGNVAAELCNVMFTIDATRGIVQSPQRNMPMRYALGELMWYMAGSNRLADIQQFSSAWDRMSDNGETVNSGYGHKIHNYYDFDQWDFVRELLKKDPLSRQAIIHIKNPSCEPTKDTPCTLSLQFLYREDALHMTTIMRSNDIWTGFPYDVFAFTAMQTKMAFELGMPIGNYTHFAGSLHLYERDYNAYMEKQGGKE